MILIIGIAVGRFTAPGDPNAEPTYGKTGLPKNCRAVIQTNLDAWAAKQYSADDIFLSISRNCGQNGYSWGR
ncbi:kynureninase [Pseudomonas kribbensis]|uniref:Kynureninase n=1 Tax=Pseudomonas kribbensis TaxID=1628086 RepID=A0A4Y8VNI6_9PSED|nr:kynureninase [Pseudomonas kribbensis]